MLFAPLYIGNKCTNSCVYCGFRAENREVVRRTLTDDELRAEVLALIARVTSASSSTTASTPTTPPK